MRNVLRRADADIHTALVTGACSGIGHAIATQLASLGYRLILVSQRAHALQKTCQQLAEQHGVTATPIVLDLACPSAAEALWSAVEKLGVEVDIWVSNAGMLSACEVAHVPLEQVQALLHLHVTTPSLLLRLVAQRQAARRRGFVLVVSSISAFGAWPTIAYYGASKRYLRSLALALRHELAPLGVGVTCLTPGSVATGLYRLSPWQLWLGAQLRILADPTDIARTALSALFARHAEVIPGWSGKAMALAMASTPAPVISGLYRMTQRLRRRPAP